jgi:hypothetical protein
MPDAVPYFEALRQHLAVESNDAPVLDSYTYHMKRTLAAATWLGIALRSLSRSRRERMRSL